jgi:hypothetical protein
MNYNPKKTHGPKSHVWCDFLHIFFSFVIHGNLMMEGKTMKNKKTNPKSVVKKKKNYIKHQIKNQNLHQTIS